jgi:hypothetical protein
MVEARALFLKILSDFRAHVVGHETMTILDAA